MKIRDLAEETINDLTYYTIIDDATFTQSKKITIDNFLEPESTIRQTDDETIRDACGLEADYTYLPDDTSNYIKTSDFVVAGLTANEKNADILLDAAIYSLANKIYLEVYLTLTQAQCLTSFTAGGTIISAPPAGYFINIKDVIGSTDPTTGMYTATGTDTLDFICNNIVLGFLSHNFLESGVYTIEKGVVNSGDGINLTPGESLKWKTTTADLTGGGAPIKIRIVFEILSDIFSTSGTTHFCCNTPVTDSFSTADLNGSGQLVINHNLNSELVLGVVITDPNGVSNLMNFQTGDGNNLFIDKANFITIDFGGAIAVGSWTYYFIVTQL